MVSRCLSCDREGLRAGKSALGLRVDDKEFDKKIKTKKNAAQSSQP
jgi:hypothetical protein